MAFGMLTSTRIMIFILWAHEHKQGTGFCVKAAQPITALVNLKLTGADLSAHCVLVETDHVVSVS